MVSQGVQLLAVSLALIGWFLVILACALPMWKVTAFVGANIITAQTVWQGLWMNCVVQSTGQMQCKLYDSMLALTSDLQAARAMTVVSVVLGALGAALAVAGGKCTNCVEDERSKARACIVGGALFLGAGLLVVVPVSWSANAIVRNFYNPLVMEAQRYELGAALYLGWAAGALLLLGGALLCWNCPPENRGEPRYGEPRYGEPRYGEPRYGESRYVPKFTPSKTMSTSREYV